MMRDHHPSRGALRGMTAQMLDDGGGYVDQLPAEQAEAAAQIHILHEHEVRLVEAVDRLERLPPQQLARPRQPAGGRLDRGGPVPAVGRRPRVRRPAPAEQGVADPAPQRGKLAGGRVEHTSRVRDRRAEGPRSRPAARRVQKLIERSRRERDVGVGHHQPRRTGTGRTPVGRAAVPEVAPSAHQPDLAALGHPGRALIQHRRVVHDNHLVGPCRGLGQGVHERTEHLTGVVAHDHDTNLRFGGGRLRPLAPLIV